MSIETESDFVNSLHVEQRKAYWKLKKQFELETFKAGERFAAEISEQQKKKWPSEQGVMYGAGYEAGGSKVTQAILTDANNRTELP